MNNRNGVLFGAALGTVLGSIAVLLYPKREEILKKSGTLMKRANEVADYLIEAGKKIPNIKGAKSKKPFMRGSVLGLIAGASAALLMAPKSGKHVRNQIAKVYQEIADKTGEIVDMVQKRTKKPIKTIRSISKKLVKRARVKSKKSSD